MDMILLKPKFGGIFGGTRKFSWAEAKFQIQLFGFALLEAESQCQNLASLPLNPYYLAL